MMSERPRPRRWLLRLLVVAVVVVGVLRAALPWVAARVAESTLTEILEAIVTIEDIDLWLLEGKVVVEGFAVYQREDEVEIAQAKRLVIDADWGAILQGRLEAEQISVDAPVVVLAFDAQGRSNWRLMDPRTAAPESEEAAEPSPAFLVRAARVDHGVGEIRFQDESEGGLPEVALQVGAFKLLGAELGRPEPGASLTWSLDSAEARDWRLAVTPTQAETLDFEIGASAGPMGDDGALPLQVSLRRPDGVELELEGKLERQPLDLELSLRWEKLQSRALLPFASLSGARIERGESRGEADLRLSFEDGPERGLTLSGEVEHRDLVFEMEGPPRTRIEMARFYGEIESVHVPIPAAPVDPPPAIRSSWSRVELESPSFEITLPRPTTQAASPPPEPDGGDAGTETDSVSTPLDLRFGQLKVRDGRLRWHDLAIGPDHVHEISGIAVDAKEVRGPEPAFEHLRLVLGSLGEKPLTVQGSWAPGTGRLDLDTSRIHLVPWNPSISHYGGYEITRGELSLRSRIRVKGDQYEAPSTVIFHRVEASSPTGRFKRIFGISLGAAIPLLSDTSGNILLNVKANGSLAGGASVDVAAAVVEALQEAIFNALGGTAALAVDSAGLALRRFGEAFVGGVAEAVFPPGDASMPIDSRAALNAAAGVVVKTRGARLELIPELVSDDLIALGAIDRDDDVFRTGLAAARAILGGGKKHSEEVTAEVRHLAEARLDAVERHLVQQSGLPRDRIVRKKWDEKVREGTPRVLVRMRGEAKKNE